jgi:hypothetical protein
MPNRFKDSPGLTTDRADRGDATGTPRMATVGWSTPSSMEC